MLRKIDYTIIKREISAAQLCLDFRDPAKILPLCKNCANFGRMWSCPPCDSFAEIFDAPDARSEIFLAQIETAAFQPLDFCDGGNAKRIKIISDAARLKFDSQMLELEKQHGVGAVAFFAGSCANCPLPVCTRTLGKPCPRPEFMRTSLEALGFDVSAIAEKLFCLPLEWATSEKLPDHIRLIAACIYKSNQKI